jgi:ATP-dependent Clp protease ATP-binding subunit ClpA
MKMSNGPVLAPDAAMVLGLAATAMPFARTSAAEAEHWLWVLRLHGQVGAALQALGVGEAPLEAPGDGANRKRPDPAKREDRDMIALVTEHAVRIANQRGAHAVGTPDVLVAVMEVYGADFERVLRAHGTDSGEVIEWLATKQPAHAGS